MHGTHPAPPASGRALYAPAAPEAKSTSTAAPAPALAVHAVDAGFIRRLRASHAACLDRKLQAEARAAHARMQLEDAQRALRAADRAYEDAYALLCAAADALQDAEAREARPFGR